MYYNPKMTVKDQVISNPRYANVIIAEALDMLISKQQPLKVIGTPLDVLAQKTQHVASRIS